MVDIATLVRRPAMPGLLGVVGDSRAVSHATSGATNQKQVSTLASWLEFFAKGRLRLSAAYDFGAGGTTVQQTIAQMTSLIAVSPRCSHVLILTGTNTFNAGGTAASAWTDLQTTIAMAIGAGLQPIVVLDLPRQQSTFSPGASAGQQSCAFNELIRRNAYRYGYLVIDLTPTLADPANSTGDPLSGLYADGIHLAQKGAVLAGREAAAYLTEIGKPHRGFSSRRDLYDATNNPTGNLYSNGLMQGTGGGNNGTGASGTVADTWRNSVAGGTGTSVASIVARTDGGAGNWQQLVITSSGAAVDVRLIPITNPTTGFAAGDLVVMEADIEIESATGLRGVTARITAYGTGFVVKGRGQYVSPVSTDTFPDGTFSGRFATPPALVTSDTINLQAEIDILTVAAGGSATIRVGGVSVRKV